MIRVITLLFVLSFSGHAQKIWTASQSNDWYKTLPWQVGCNFAQSTAINELEMWQAVES